MNELIQKRITGCGDIKKKLNKKNKKKTLANICLKINNIYFLM